MLVLNDVSHDRRVRDLAPVLVDAGWRVLIIGTQRTAGPLPDREQWVGGDLWRVRYGQWGSGLWRPWRWIRHLLQAGQLMRALWSVEGRVWHAHDLHALIVMALARWIGRRQVHLIYDMHDLLLFMSPRGSWLADGWTLLLRPLSMRIEAFLARRVAAVLATCEPKARMLVHWYHIPRPVVVHTLLDPVPADAPSPVDLRSVVGAGNRCVVHTGDITNRGRCLTELVAAMQYLPDDVHLAFLGQGEDADGLRERAEQLGIGARVHLVPPVPPEDVARVIRSADAAAILLRPDAPNIRLAIPNKLWEALAAGLPVISSRSFAMRRIVERYELGLICDATDPRAIAAALEDVLTPEAQARYRANAQAAQVELNWTRERKKLIDVYRTLLGEP